MFDFNFGDAPTETKHKTEVLPQGNSSGLSNDIFDFFGKGNNVPAAA